MTRAPQGVARLALVLFVLTACSQTTDVYLGADDALQAPPAANTMLPPTSPGSLPASPQPVAQTPPADSGILGDAGNAPPELTPPLPSDAGSTLDAALGTSDAGVTPSPVCSPGAADCDGDPSNGCESNIDSDLQNCGGCARLCHTMGHDAITASCVAGRCELTCRVDGVGDHDCDGDPDNGCETKTLTDAQNCGGCGIVCNACLNGRCL